MRHSRTYGVNAVAGLHDLIAAVSAPGGQVLPALSDGTGLH
jgi:hypothetical protein